ncbi:unnamed protein product [Paramecium sonneborni]|uniref:Transmembrane protein n=1 Tax=Paramecium sonneborni TaxID=65129 RepID=A0A8S1NCX1_9CILI|nr:unnamed protein product [Paramecium sonneborni]
MNYSNYAQYSNSQDLIINTQQKNCQSLENKDQISVQKNNEQPIYQNHMVQPVNYPCLSYENESVCGDQQEPNHIIHNEYLQQQQQLQVAQEQKPYQQIKVDDNQTQNIYTDQQIATPFIQTENVNNEDKLNEKCRRDLISKINCFWIIQEIIQIILCIINMASYSYDSIFFDYSAVEYRLTFYVFLILTFGYMIVIRFTKRLWDKQGYQGIIYIIYAILYSFFISGIVSSSHISYNYEKIYFLIGFLYFIGTIGILIMLIQFQVQIKYFKEEEMNLKEFLRGIMAGPLGVLFVISALFGIDSFTILLFYEIVWSFFFTLFYIYSLLQIYRGKFKLRKDQYFVGVVLTYINMLIPFVH